MLYITALLLQVCLWVFSPLQTRRDPCKVFGAVFVVQNRNQSEVRVFLEETESFAELVVYQQPNRFFADRSGQWFFTTDRRAANYWVYFEDVKGMADFSIAYTETESFAGCKN